MHWVTQVLGSIITTIIAGAHILFGGAVQQSTPPSPVPHAENIAVATSTIVEITPTTTAATSTPPKKALPMVKPLKKPALVALQPPATSSAPQVPAPTASTLDATTLNSDTRSALANIYCTVRSGPQTRLVTGSGVFIDTRGAILTNAHIAQFLLLGDSPEIHSDCAIRTGSPARAAYSAVLLYFPPQWVKEYGSQLKSEQPMGTGEYDYALLYVTKSATNDQLPFSFPAVPMSKRLLSPGQSIFLAAYPAGFLGSTLINNGLFISTTYATVSKYFTFATSTADIMSLGGSIVAQAGSSGGAVVDPHDGALVGIIVTDTASSTTSGRDLRALTVNYINRHLAAEGFGGLSGFLSADLSKVQKTFETDVQPSLRDQLLSALK